MELTFIFKGCSADAQNTYRHPTTKKSKQNETKKLR
jgi:hypothetical protein